jgi:hypothetical protein
MGWASGSSLAEDVLKVVSPHIERRSDFKAVAKRILDLFEGHDCDTLDELRGQWAEVDELLDERYPEVE